MKTDEEGKYCRKKRRVARSRGFRGDGRTIIAALPEPLMKKTTTFPVLLVLVAALAAVAYGCVAVNRGIEYDGFWHVFMAGQDRFRMFVRETLGDAHPPLFYVLLRMAMRFGRSRLVYRAVSLASGVASILLVGRIARDLGAERAVAGLAAFTFAFSIDTLTVANEIRSYMLAAAFALAAIDLLVRAVRIGARAGLLPRLAAASVFAMLALLSDYSAIFVLSAAVAVAAVAASGDRALRARILEKGTAPKLVACAVAALVPAAVFFRLARQRSFARPIGYLSRFYYSPHGIESLPGFLLRTARSEAALFLPFSGKRGIAIAAVAVVVGGSILASRAGRRRRLAGFPALVLVVAAAEMTAGAIAGVYPFGGALRQQFVLFPFAVLAAALGFQGIASPLRSRGLRAAVIVIPALGVAASFALRFGSLRQPTGEPIAESDAVFRKAFPDPPLVYADQFSVIALFAGRDRWTWTAQDSLPGAPSAVVYRVSQRASSFLLVRDRWRWNIDFGQTAFYELLRQCLAVSRSKTVTVFESADRADPIGADEASRIRERIRLGAMAAGLSAGRIDVLPRNVFFEVTTAP
ncbi:MAG TPA: hypothetical protein VFL12_02820 [Thermoanaerobaculia bacterium]|nr:hypothetical protein [Thermoanaerobaculia bacterium]